MKMKLVYALGLFGLVLWTACNKALDMAPDGKISIDEVFQDDAKVRAYLNTCYDNMPGKGTLYYFWSRGPVVWSDEAWDTDAEAEPTLMSGRMYNGNASADNHPAVNVSAENGNGNYWARYWNAIYNCSVFISRIDQATVIEEKNRPRWKAEAHLLRAYYYAELLKWYGAALPIIREPHHFSDDFSSLQKASYYEVVKFIEEDCNVALATPELPWRITSSAEAGRVNKAMAEAIKSKMMLFAASPLYNNGQDHWQEAYELNKASLENLRAKGFALYNQVNFPQTYQSATAFFGPDNNAKAALYNEYFTNTMAYATNPVDKETLYQSRQGQGDVWYMDGIGAQDGYKSGTCPSQEIVDAYETKDGQPILDLDQPYLDEKHLQPNYNPNNTLYDPQDPYANRDPRFYASIYYNGSKRKANWSFAEAPESPENYPASNGNRVRIISTYIGEPRTGIHASTRSATRTGYYERKFLHPSSGSDNRVAGANWKLFRLGEVILNFAEAAAESGHLDEARAAVNEIRARVDMPPVSAGLSQQELITRVRHERQVELAFEENRYFDVRRWSSPTADLSNTDKWITAAAITRNADGSYTYNRRTVRSESRLCYINKYLFLPIPLAEANRLLAITGANWQNSGW
ncbi:RagB/SusD family nutrient uptake outer membrane protein [Olivibacter ginsenosidimutans]|uniref:RagB/SusD family nutrient uptake outer membrane protein n=1 Tax=Olivibacter ginsenosidimutans TaxID=1176537 RepID=A0ABP9BQW9_9SPHI